MTEPKPLLSSAAAARALGVGRTTLWRWKQDGVVEPALYTAGGQARWNLDELRHQLSEHRAQMHPDDPNGL